MLDPAVLAFAECGHGMSFGGIQSRGDLTFDVFGCTVLKSIYTVFDGTLLKTSKGAPSESC